jgi:hypothetical protein
MCRWCTKGYERWRLDVHRQGEACFYARADAVAVQRQWRRRQSAAAAVAEAAAVQAAARAVYVALYQVLGEHIAEAIAKF